MDTAGPAPSPDYLAAAALGRAFAHEELLTLHGTISIRPGPSATPAAAAAVQRLLGIIAAASNGAGYR